MKAMSEKCYNTYSNLGSIATEKCQFRVPEVGFSECVINSDGIGIESDRISTIEDRPPL